MVLKDSEEHIQHYKSTEIENYYVKPKDSPYYIESNNNYYGEENVSKPDAYNKRALLAQCSVALAVLILTASCGLPVGYSAILLPQLYNGNQTFYVSPEMGSWIASVHSLAVPLGAIVSAVLSDVIGRRGCLQLSAIPLCLGWLAIGFSQDIFWMLTGRIILGFSVGLVAVPSQVLTGETANPKLRGTLLGSAFSAYSTGILFVYVLGAYLHWKTVSFIAIVLPVTALVSLFFVPESPIWLVRQNKIEKARKALLWLRGNDVEQVNREIVVLETRTNNEKAQKCKATTFPKKVSSAMTMISSPGVFKPLIILNIFSFLQQLSGSYVVVFYGVEIAKTIGGKTINENLAAIVMAVVRLFASVLSCFLLLRLGRRTLCIVSAAGTALASFVIVGYLLLKKEGSDLDIYIITMCLLLYVGFNTVGLLCLPLIMMGELLPPRVRGLFGGIIYSIFNLLLFGVTKIFPKMQETIGMIGIFSVFGTSGFLVILFTYFLLPETKDRSLEEIEDYFETGHLPWKGRPKEKSNENFENGT